MPTRTSPQFLAIAAVVVAAFLADSAHAAIVAVNDGFFGGGDPGDGPSVTVTQSVTVGAAADMLILMTSSEMGSATTTATYGGVPMTFAVGNAPFSNIFYLDLSVGGFSNTNIAVTLTSGTINGFAAGWVSIDGNLGVGESIALHSTGTSTPDFNTVDLTTTVETFNVVNFNANGTNGTITIGAPIAGADVIYTDNNIGSSRGAAAFDAGVAAGTTNYSWSISGEAAPPNTDYRRIDAAAFAVVPEPTTSALIGTAAVGGLLTLCRRRRG